MKLAISATEILERLRDADWFSKVGEEFPPSRTVKTWKEALAWSAEPGWPDVRLMWANELRSALQKKAMDRYRLWNKVVVTAKPNTEAIVRLKCENVVRKHGLSKSFVDDVQWDVLHCVVEAEYSDVAGVLRYAALADAYAGGHWPCGWHGSAKSGQLVVL